MKNTLIKTIPYIDVKKLLAGEISPASFLNIFHKYGFAYLYNLDFDPLNIGTQQFKMLQSSAQSFFDLPLEKKMQYYIGASPNHRGYVPVSEKGAYGDEKIRVYEAFDMSYSLPGTSKEDHQKLRGENVWPQEISDFRNTCESYYNQMFLLGKSLLRIFAQAFDLPENYFDAYTQHPPAQLRLLNYLSDPRLNGQEDVAMGAHTDYECFTFLYQTSPGIQGDIHRDGEFINLPVFKNTLLMITGDMMHFMTNGYLRSLYHRVINNGAQRLSFPFFMNFDFETQVEVLPKFQDFQAKDYNVQQKLPEKIVVGQHLLGQLYRDFPYLKAKIDMGDWKVPFSIPKYNLFERV